jgi:exonuclease SbcD
VAALKICHIADIHLGYRRFSKLTRQGFNQREADVSAAFQEALQLAQQVQPDLTIIAGDVFHSVRPSNSVITFCLRQLYSYQKKTQAPTIIVAGNHESPKRADTGCVLQILARAPDVYVVDARHQRLKFSALNLSVDCVPHNALKNFNWAALRSDSDAHYNVLITHAQVKGAPGSEGGGYDLDPELLRQTDWDYIALGHVHRYVKFGDNCCYPGALDFTSNNIWAELEEEKGPVIFELPSKSFSKLKLTGLRSVLDLPELELDGKSASEVMQVLSANIDRITGGLEGKIIRQKLSSLDRAAYRSLDQKQLRNWRSQALHLFLDIEFSSKVSLVKAFKEAGNSLENRLQSFIEAQQPETSAEREALSQLLAGYINKTEVSNEAD